MKPHLFIIMLSAFVAAACDSGDIYEQAEQTASADKRVVKLTLDVSGLSTLLSKYTLSLAAFKPNEKYATKLLNITDDGSKMLTMTNDDPDVSTVELAVTDRLRHRVLTLSSVDYSSYAEDVDTIYMTVGQLDASHLNCLQQFVFNRACVQCHGANGRMAGGLDLTDGNTLAALLDQPSHAKEDATRVVAGNASGSLLHQILDDGGENLLHYNHVEVLSSHFKENLQEVRKFIDDWINGL